MIGGTDISIPTFAETPAMDVGVRAILREWPQAVFEDPISGQPFDRYEALPFGHLRELFVYRDQHVARAWEDEGAVPSLANTMIHLLASPTHLTLVLDDLSSQSMHRILSAIRCGLRMDILNLTVQPKEAA